MFWVFHEVVFLFCKILVSPFPFLLFFPIVLLLDSRTSICNNILSRSFHKPLHNLLPKNGHFHNLLLVDYNLLLDFLDYLYRYCNFLILNSFHEDRLYFPIGPLHDRLHFSEYEINIFYLDHAHNFLNYFEQTCATIFDGVMLGTIGAGTGLPILFRLPIAQGRVSLILAFHLFFRHTVFDVLA